MLFENEIDQLLTQAESLLQDQKPGEALDVLDRARTLEPGHAWTQLFRGVALGQLGRTDEAIEQLLAAADSHAEDIDIQVDAARHLSLLEQHQDALICAHRAVGSDGGDAGAHAIRAEVLEHLGRISEALPDREAVLLLDADDPDSRYFLAVDLCDLGRFDEAYRHAEPLFAQFPDDPDILRLHGACLSYLDRHQQALSKWAELERLEGVTPNLLHNRASTLDALGLHEEALATITEAIALEPDVAINHYTRGMIHEHRGDDQAALNDYLTALSFDHQHLDAVINLVELAVAADVVPATAERLRTLVGQHPTSAKLLYAHGRLQMEQGDLAQAQRTLEEALCREPSLGICWYTLSMLYGIAGKAEDALLAADRAMQDFPDDPGIWLNRGQAYELLHQQHEAVACYDRAVEVAPTESTPWFHLGRVLLLDLGRPNSARGPLREAVRLQPDHDAAMWMLALCYLRMNQLDDALRETRQLLARYPNHPWGRVLSAIKHVQRDETDAALLDLRAAVAQGYEMRLLQEEPLFEPLWSDPRFQAAFSGPRDRRV